MLNRRRFVCMLGGLIVLGSSRWTPAAAGGVSLHGPWTRATFAALVRDPFSLLLGDRAAGLFLVSVVDDGSNPSREQFTVVFQGPREFVLLEGLYRVSHVTAGTTDVFLQPAGHDRRYAYYQACFNLLRA